MGIRPGTTAILMKIRRNGQKQPKSPPELAVIAVGRGPISPAIRHQRPFFFPRAADFFATFFVEVFVPFFFADFLAAVTAFLEAGPFFAALFVDETAALPPPKIAVQLSANFFVAPTRVLLIAKLSPSSELKSC